MIHQTLWLALLVLGLASCNSVRVPAPHPQLQIRPDRPVPKAPDLMQDHTTSEILSSDDPTAQNNTETP